MAPAGVVRPRRLPRCRRSRCSGWTARTPDRLILHALLAAARSCHRSRRRAGAGARVSRPAGTPTATYPGCMPRNRSSARRRQRSVRVTVAVFLLAVATVAVLAALPTQSPALLSVAAVAALVLGWAALRIVWTEVLQSRREHATDRAATATRVQDAVLRAGRRARRVHHGDDRAAGRVEPDAARAPGPRWSMAQRQTARALVRAESAESAHASALVRVAELERSIEMLRADGDRRGPGRLRREDRPGGRQARPGRSEAGSVASG